MQWRVEPTAKYSAATLAAVGAVLRPLRKFHQQNEVTALFMEFAALAMVCCSSGSVQPACFPGGRSWWREAETARDPRETNLALQALFDGLFPSPNPSPAKMAIFPRKSRERSRIQPLSGQPSIEDSLIFRV